MSNLSIEQAIQHAEDKSLELGSCECGAQHAQLAKWLCELLAHRKASEKPVTPFGYVHQCDHFFTNDHGNIYKTPGGHFTRPLYSSPPLQAVPTGWKLVPVEPTENMVVEGFESEPDSFFSNSDDWEAYKAMSGCQQAAHKARLCWAAMIAAAPSITNEP